MTSPEALPWATHTVLSQDGSQSEGFWEVPDSFTMAWHYPLTSDPQGAFLCTCQSPLSQTGESGDPSVLHADRILPPLSLPWLLPWLLPELSESTWDKDWSLTLFLLLLLFWRANRRLIVNSSTGAHLSLVSGNVNSSKYPAWSPLLPAPWNADRRPTVKVWPGAHLSPAKSVSY